MLVSMPFIELRVGDHFVLHRQHRRSNRRSLCVKTSRDTYKNVRTGVCSHVSNVNLGKIWASMLLE